MQALRTIPKGADDQKREKIIRECITLADFASFVVMVPRRAKKGTTLWYTPKESWELLEATTST